MSKKIDPLIREKHKRMVQAMLERQRAETVERNLEDIVTATKDSISQHLLNENAIKKELESLATILLAGGKTKDDYLDAVAWMEDQLGVKLLPAKKVH